MEQSDLDFLETYLCSANTTISSLWQRHDEQWPLTQGQQREPKHQDALFIRKETHEQISWALKQVIQRFAQGKADWYWKRILETQQEHQQQARRGHGHDRGPVLA